MTMEANCPLCGRRMADLLTACRQLLEICRWKCSPSDEVLLSDGTTNEQAMIQAMDAIADAEALFSFFQGICD